MPSDPVKKAMAQQERRTQCMLDAMTYGAVRRGRRRTSKRKDAGSTKWKWTLMLLVPVPVNLIIAVRCSLFTDCTVFSTIIIRVSTYFCLPISLAIESDYRYSVNGHRVSLCSVLCRVRSFLCEL